MTKTNIYNLCPWIKCVMYRKSYEEDMTMVKEALFEFCYLSFVSSFVGTSMALMVFEGGK